MELRQIRILLLSFLSLHSYCSCDLRRDDYQQQVIDKENYANAGHHLDTQTHVFKESVHQLLWRSDLVKRDLTYRL